MAESGEARELAPYSTVKEGIFGKDFGVKLVSSEPDEPAVEPAPKEESARESVVSSESTPTAEQEESGTPVQAPASKENGKDSEQTEPEKTESPNPESSSPSSSSTTNPGSPAPPAPTLPPIDVPTPKP